MLSVYFYFIKTPVITFLTLLPRQGNRLLLSPPPQAHNFVAS